MESRGTSAASVIRTTLDRVHSVSGSARLRRVSDKNSGPCVNERRGRGFFPMLSLVGHPSGGEPLMMDVSQSRRPSLPAREGEAELRRRAAELPLPARGPPAPAVAATDGGLMPRLVAGLSRCSS